MKVARSWWSTLWLTVLVSIWSTLVTLACIVLLTHFVLKKMNIEFSLSDILQPIATVQAMKVEDDEVVLNVAEIRAIKDRLTTKERQELLQLITEKLQVQDLQQLSQWLEHGVTKQELQQMETLMRHHFDDQQVDRYLQILR
jgi:hypothetical protein